MVAVEVERQVGALDDRLLGDQREVVAVERDVERADREADALMLRDRVGEPMGERDAAALDADEREALGAGVLLDDLVADADGRAPNLLGGHDLPAAHRREDTRASWPGRPLAAAGPLLDDDQRVVPEAAR